jgi:hypothetical protein
MSPRTKQMQNIHVQYRPPCTTYPCTYTHCNATFAAAKKLLSTVLLLIVEKAIEKTGVQASTHS